MQIFFLGIYGGYKEITVGIFAAQTANFAGSNLDSETISNANASKQLVFVIDRLLTKHDVSLQDLAFIFVNQGPAPFTTLRTVLTTVNALSFARNIPLVGIDSLKALVSESASSCDNKNIISKNNINIALLDAFNNDVYYCFKADTDTYVPDLETEYEAGYENVAAFIIRLKKLLELSLEKNKNTRLCLSGNGAQLHRQALEAALPDHVVWDADMQTTATFSFMAQLAFQQFNAGHVSSKLSPLYLKLHPAQLALQKA